MTSLRLPRHLAIIMDGNGRWAQARRRPRIYGHVRGSSRVRPIVTECGKIGVKYLTLFCFSAENWGRPADEVGILMRILRKYLVRERSTLMKNNVKLRAIGDVELLPKEVRKTLLDTIELTARNTGLVLTFALSYGARQEIVHAVKKISAQVRDSKISVDQIDESMIEKNLFTADYPDPDLVIRSSGEYRLSNFLLWQAAYSELFISDKFWPDFDIAELHRAISNFAQRERRFGLTTDQIVNLDTGRDAQ